MSHITPTTSWSNGQGPYAGPGSLHTYRHERGVRDGRREGTEHCERHYTSMQSSAHCEQEAAERRTLGEPNNLAKVDPNQVVWND